ncbi:hypothetical protein CCAL12920_00670 [Campylobacter sp. RM12920]|uniref:DUF4376 domain-containing protein n=1 Tax=Campylobacter californiensis TaxID=1032243 RepID=A0ABD4JFJ2_9BACT|nr:hypothetical protein [Campylobacter sp. RM9328]MBE2985558.1 hypothetical protein [Campylobacter sp. RM12919]MBE2987413.1 hypothetical protein [Campylobacter sp. RM12920]
MKYTHYNKETKQILGYYDDEIHESIPEPNFQISDEIWQEAIDKNANKVDAKTKTLFFEAKEPTLEELKSLKLTELELWFEAMKNKSKIELKGFGIIDGGYKYLLNASAMVENYELLPQKVFRMWDDSFKPIDLNGLKAIKRAIELAGIKLHSIKWEYEARIASANDKDELEAIVFYDVIEIDLGASNE